MNDDMVLFVQQQSTKNTQDAYRNDLSKWTAFLDGRNPDARIALAFRESLEATSSNSTALRAFGTAKGFYQWTGGYNPFLTVKSPKRVSDWTPKLPAPGEVDSLWRTVDNARDRAIIALLMNGLRESEVVNLDRDDIERHQGATVMRVIGKGNKMRLVPLNEEGERALLAWVATDKWHKTPIFTDIRGSRITRRMVYYVVEKWSKRAGVSGMHPHKLRHDFATRLVRSGVQQNALQKLLGHKRAETTSVYVSLDLGDLIKAVGNDPRNKEPDGT